ncbi:alpha-1,2-mannosyltransferase ALG9-like isoform X2 [Actinia tenebrosa]|uniref:Mannosyltransferase n=1 Tax=Actinia tenebrosa TaxID=6105 RepID=A0A6P8H072_ACTTE|nr:alpha-1,2-mannosyltransferase ALG9-like isoform X2 [Actinia tenebrosa]
MYKASPPIGKDTKYSDYTSENVWCPKPYTMFKLLLSARFCSAFLSNISDCDETFNYWEPTHYLLYGTGFQTWEYSPQFAIRSYGYLLLNSVSGFLQVHLFKANKVLVFYFLRFILSIICAASESYFYSGIIRQFGSHVARLSAVFMVFATGMFISAAAFLPSTFAMYMVLLSYGGWFTGHYPIAVVCTAAGALVGWPFSAVLGAPIAWDIVIRQRRLRYFLEWCIISLIAVLGPLVYIDSAYYGKVVIAPLNIVMYNVFGKGGPDLYGVEHWTFYFINGFLNFNVVFLMAVLVFPICVFVKLLVKEKNERRKFPSSRLPVWFPMAAMYIWIGIFFTRPHKEERFLFPIYPLFILFGAVSLSKVQKLFHHLFTRTNRQHYSVSSTWLAVTVGVVFSLLSLSRSSALFYGYHAPLDLYLEINHMTENLDKYVNRNTSRINVCVGKEWYRYPSSFFLPDDRWRLQFIESEFRAQLPKPYATGSNATMIIPTDMNDMNKEEPSRYVPLNQCHFLVDMDTGRETAREPNYSKQKNRWAVIATKPFLDNERSHRLLRAFYVPFLSESFTRYNDYNLLWSLKAKTNGKKRRRQKVHYRVEKEK